MGRPYHDGMTTAAASLSHGIPGDAQRQLAAMAAAGLQALAFTPTGGWVIVGTPGARDTGYAARGIPDACFVKLGEFMRAGQRIRSIAFMPADAQRWVIVSDQAYFASRIPDNCFDALADAWAQGLRPSCIAFAPGDGWAMLAGAEVRGEGIDRGCWQQLKNFAQGLRPAQQLAFAPAGGWVLLARDRWAAQGIGEACRAHIGQVAQAHEVAHIAFAPDGGWAVGSNTPRSGDALPVDPLREFEDKFRLVNGSWRSLAERMAVQRVSGASIRLRIDGEPDLLIEHGNIDATLAETLVFESGAARFEIVTAGGAAASLAEEIEAALRRVYPAA